MSKMLLTVLISAATVIAAAGVVYAATGGPPSPVLTADRVPSEAGAAASAEPTDVPAPDPRSPLATSIPGCVCHSDDPVLVEEHAAYRMNQCFGCHGSTPTGQ